MLKIKGVRHFKRTVKLRIPSETKPDAYDEASFVASFKALSRSEIETLQAEKQNDRAFLLSILVGVDGIGDADGNPMPSDAARDAVIEDLLLCSATVEVFNEQFAKAKAGN